MTCVWIKESEVDEGYDDQLWLALGCDNKAVLSDQGSPIDNNFKFCPFCGKEILEVMGTLDEWRFDYA